MQGDLGFFNSTGDVTIGGFLGNDKQYSDFNFLIDPATLPSQIIQVTFGCRLVGSGSISFGLRQGGNWQGPNDGFALIDGSVLIASDGPFTAPGGLGLIEWTSPPFDIGAVLTRLYITYSVGANSLGTQDPFLISISAV